MLGLWEPPYYIAIYSLVWLGPQDQASFGKLNELEYAGGTNDFASSRIEAAINTAKIL